MNMLYSCEYCYKSYATKKEDVPSYRSFCSYECYDNDMKDQIEDKKYKRKMKGKW